MSERVIIDVNRNDFINAIADAVINKLHLIAPGTENEFMTATEVTKLLRISRTTLYNWTNEGKILPVAVGNKFLYRRSEVLCLIAA
jgi:excisionase family DNA binding protein